MIILNCGFSAKVTFYCKQQYRNYQKLTLWNLVIQQYFPSNSFKGTVVNRALSYLYGSSLKNTSEDIF